MLARNTSRVKLSRFNKMEFSNFIICNLTRTEFGKINLDDHPPRGCGSFHISRACSQFKWRFA